MVDPGYELNLGRLEGVVGRELDIEEEDTALEGRVDLLSKVRIKSKCYRSATLRVVARSIRQGVHPSLLNVQVPQ